MATTTTYTEKQIDYIKDKKVEGYTYDEIAEMFNDKFYEDKNGNQMRDVFNRYKKEYDLPEIEAHPDKVRRQKKTEIMDNYLEFVRYNKFAPTQNDLSDLGFSISVIRNHYDSIDGLEEEARENYKSVFTKVIDEYAFTDEEYHKLKADIKKYKRSVITTAVTGCEVHQASLDSLKNYCKRKKAKLLVLPCSDPASNRKHKWSLDYKLSKSSVVFRDLQLNDKLFLSTIKLSAKHINPLTGMFRIGQKSGSFVYASPKQFLEHVASSNAKKTPKALMTTGAITKPQYQTEKYMSERTAYIADHDHVIGAVIVEIKDNKRFFYRQIQMEPKTGAFIDLDTKYFADGRTAKSEADLVQFGDYHWGDTDPKAKAGGKKLCDLVRPKYLTVEDFFNGHSINHHETKLKITQALKYEKGLLELKTELKGCSNELSEILSWGNFDQLVLKYGNHEDFIKRYLESADYVEQPQNHRIAVKLADAMFDGKMPFEFAMRELYPVEGQKYMKFLGVNASFKLSGIENGAHGHLGSGGTRNPSLAGLERCYGSVNAAHNHSAGILRNVFRVGTKSFLKVSYNDGPSAWTQTDLVQHTNGSRQLITYIDGEFTI